MSSEAAATALKSRAEVQLLNVLNQKKVCSASHYLKKEQERVRAEERDETQEVQGWSRMASEAIPPCSETVRLITEVRQLEDNFALAGALRLQKSEEGPHRIELNNVRRRDHHMEAQLQYENEVRSISENVEVAIIQAADHVKEVLATIDAEIREAEAALTNNKVLLASDNDNVLDMWRQIEAICQRRTHAITRFAAQLNEIEQTRVHQVRVGLQRLTCVLMETAHALPPEVERIIEAEAYEVNIVVISNRRVYADLVARMETANTDIFLKSRLEWERGQLLWRHLRHDDAIARCQATLNSHLFTDPEDRKQTLQQIRVFQQQIHSEQRLTVLKQLSDAGASLTSDLVERLLQELSATQQFEDEKNQIFFSKLRDLHDSRVEAAKSLREALRLELHGFGAMAKEGAIKEAKSSLMTLLSDDSMETFFRAAGGLKSELDAFAKKLCVADLIYNANLEPIVSSVGILFSALPLKNVMESQGKEAERKAMQSTLEKMRQATKAELMTLLPSLQTQMSVLLNLDEMSATFKGEVGGIMTQLDTITREYGLHHATNALASSLLQRTGSISMLDISANAENSPDFKGNVNDASQSIGHSIDLQAIRKVQRRLGTLMYVSELDERWQQSLYFIVDQLSLQTNANRSVDEVISRECDDLIDKRREESRLLVAEMGKRMEQQSAMLHDHVEKLAKFFLQVVLCMEESVSKVHYVNLSVMDLFDTLKENDQETLGDLETGFQQSCARLRHSPNDVALRNELERSSELLKLIEREYRAYEKRVSLAADNNVIAIAKQRLLYLQRLCDLFGLKQSNQPENDDTFNLDDFLSVRHIEQVLTPVTSARNADDTVKTTMAAPIASTFSSSEEIFRTASGLEVAVTIPIASLVRTILTQNEDAGLDSSRSIKLSNRSTTGGHEDDGDTRVTEANDLQRLEQLVRHKVQNEFLVLDVPHDTVESLLDSYRTAIFFKYDSDAVATSTRAKESCEKRHADSSLLLEERLRTHWSRKERLDKQFYQPRMSELSCHQQRNERHLRGVWKKVEQQQVAFASKVKGAFLHVEQAQMTQVGFQVQLPLQTSLAALQGLEAKAKKCLAVFKGEAMERVLALRAMFENDINSLLSCSQDYIRACSSQLFADLTSCEAVSGNDYHPEEITLIKEKFDAIEAQVRDELSKQEEQVVEISSKQSQVLEMWHTFKAKHQTCMQNLAMKEGLGQKFGLPRRTAQERYRSEMTRCELRSAAIDALLSSLQSLVDEEKGNSHLKAQLHEQELTSRVLRILMQLRAKIYHRGMYFDLLQNPSQLELQPIEFDLAAGRETKGSQEVIRDREVVDEEDWTVATPFLEFAAQVSTRCQEETRALYHQEGRLEELPPSGVPTALEEYLSSQMEKARSFVLLQEKAYREQVGLFAHLLTLVPKIMVMNLEQEAKQEMLRNISTMNTAFEAQYQQWMNLKTQHMFELRPHLCSPNNADLLRELEERESTRSMSVQGGLYDLRSHFLTEQIRLSSTFEAALLELCRCLMLLLDSSVLSLDDLKPSSGEELPKLKRKSLKRLRKVARVNESGDSREVPRLAAEMLKLNQCNEAPRFPLRSWPGIPSLGLQTLWEEIKGAVLAKDLQRQSPASASIGKTNSSTHAQPVNNGACVALLTPTHRVLIRARDAVYADYLNLCRDETHRFLDLLHGRLEDEVKWTLSWVKGIQTLRQSKVD